MFIFVSHGETYLQEPPFPMDLRLTVRFICWQGLPYKQCTVFMGINRTAGGSPAPRASHPRVVLTRPYPLPATLSTLGLWLQGSLIVLSACRCPQGAALAFRRDGCRSAFPRRGKVSWRVRRVARREQIVSVALCCTAVILRAFFVKVQQIGRSERGKGKPFQRARLVSSW